MKSEYDDIASSYKDSKNLPFRKHIEAYTFLKTVGSVKDKECLDLACGDGYYSRLMNTQGAKRVVGVDYSKEMISLAKSHEESKESSMSYIHSDAKSLPASIGQFDVVIATYLFNYSQSLSDLKAFAHSCYSCLKAGGRLIALNDSPENHPNHFKRYKKYGFVKHADLPLKIASPITYDFFPDTDKNFSFKNFYFPKAYYEEALYASGFTDVSWHDPLVSKEGLETFGEDYWQDFLLDSPIAIFSAQKNHS